MFNAAPRIIIAALRGGSGKTILSVGLTAAWQERGIQVAPFKKGPDFIDAGWLTFAAGRFCYNLDPFLMTDAQILHSFFSHSGDSDICLIEGNRGLFDGFDVKGHCSTAELGKLLKAPIILIADVTMATRTIAALIMGCQKFDPALNIAGVILNRVAGPRQETLVRNSVERYCEIPVIGAVPKLKEDLFPERHMGLVPHLERKHAEKAVAWAKSNVERNLDLGSLWSLSHQASPLNRECQNRRPAPPEPSNADPPRIGYIRDKAFWFYYPENLEALRSLGATLVEINSLEEKELPDLDALYIGGGFPETQVQALTDNKSFRDSLKEEIQNGLPVYAECGGLMYLGESLLLKENTYPMVGALPLHCVMEEKPQGHGYTMLEVLGNNPYYPVGETLKGHEFHYSRPIMSQAEKFDPVFKVLRGRGIDGDRDGLCKKNLLATFTHVHAAGNDMWGKGLFRAALERQKRKETHFSTG
ncbi:MAG: hydrogenobyrinic acid a,c-diamide synthase (glutamine-hydrolyzing) [Deltaproteobacteria bacterium]|nr:hydrogenobyrinic acid a,c-diamide synthase (glutamine-hydrolyzing) [Deltaproteobacteria bacterium]